MSDALCGPSNALQSFQKHASVDRTLQQDRLSLRQTQPQGFRSTHGQPARVLDNEFEAFQAGYSPENLQPGLDQHFRGPPAQHVNGHIPSPVSQPSWATDFQRLNISTPPPQAHFSAHIAAQRTSQMTSPDSWHHEFMKHSSPSSFSQTPSIASRAPFGGLTGYTPTFQSTGAFASEISGQNKGKGRAMSPLFDDAAFERAFDAAQADLVGSSPAVEPVTAQPEQMANGRLPEEANPLMRMTWENQPATYLVVRIWNAFGLSTTGEPFQHDTAQHASAFLSELELLQSQGLLKDEAEVLRAKKVLHRVLQLSNIPDDGEYRFSARAQNLLEKIIQQVDQRESGSLKDEGLPRDTNPMEAGQVPHEVVAQEFPEAEQAQQHQPIHDDEELARTAGQLLESVSDNTSKKFQESNFLALMRKLRDHEVRVEGDKMVEATLTSDQTTRIPFAEQDVDLGRIPPTNQSDIDGPSIAVSGARDASAYIFDPSYGWIRYALEILESTLTANINEERAWTDFGRARP